MEITDNGIKTSISTFALHNTLAAADAPVGVVVQDKIRRHSQNGVRLLRRRRHDSNSKGGGG